MGKNAVVISTRRDQSPLTIFHPPFIYHSLLRKRIFAMTSLKGWGRNYVNKTAWNKIASLSQACTKHCHENADLYARMLIRTW